MRKNHLLLYEIELSKKKRQSRSAENRLNRKNNVSRSGDLLIGSSAIRNEETQFASFEAEQRIPHGSSEGPEAATYGVETDLTANYDKEVGDLIQSHEGLKSNEGGPLDDGNNSLKFQAGSSVSIARSLTSVEGRCTIIHASPSYVTAARDIALESIQKVNGLLEHPTALECRRGLYGTNSSPRKVVHRDFRVEQARPPHHVSPLRRSPSKLSVEKIFLSGGLPIILNTEPLVLPAWNSYFVADKALSPITMKPNKMGAGRVTLFNQELQALTDHTAVNKSRHPQNKWYRLSSAGPHHENSSRKKSIKVNVNRSSSAADRGVAEQQKKFVVTEKHLESTAAEPKVSERLEEVDAEKEPPEGAERETDYNVFEDDNEPDRPPLPVLKAAEEPSIIAMNDEQIALVEDAEALWEQMIIELRDSGMDILYKDLVEISSLREAPDAVVAVIGYINLLLGLQPNWQTAKRSLFKELIPLQTFFREVEPLTVPIRRLKKAVELKRTQQPFFSVEALERACHPAVKLLRWVQAFDDMSLLILAVDTRRQHRVYTAERLRLSAEEQFLSHDEPETIRIGVLGRHKNPLSMSSSNKNKRVLKKRKGKKSSHDHDVSTEGFEDFFASSGTPLASGSSIIEGDEMGVLEFFKDLSLAPPPVDTKQTNSVTNHHIDENEEEVVGELAGGERGGGGGSLKGPEKEDSYAAAFDGSRVGHHGRKPNSLLTAADVQPSQDPLTRQVSDVIERMKSGETTARTDVVVDSKGGAVGINSSVKRKSSGNGKIVIGSESDRRLSALLSGRRKSSQKSARWSAADAGVLGSAIEEHFEEVPPKDKLDTETVKITAATKRNSFQGIIGSAATGTGTSTGIKGIGESSGSIGQHHAVPHLDDGVVTHQRDQATAAGRSQRNSDPPATATSSAQHSQQQHIIASKSSKKAPSTAATAATAAAAGSAAVSTGGGSKTATTTATVSTHRHTTSTPTAAAAAFPRSPSSAPASPTQSRGKTSITRSSVMSDSTFGSSYDVSRLPSTFSRRPPGGAAGASGVGPRDPLDRSQSGRMISDAAAAANKATVLAKVPPTSLPTSASDAAAASSTAARTRTGTTSTTSAAGATTSAAAGAPATSVMDALLSEEKGSSNVKVNVPSPKKRLPRPASFMMLSGGVIGDLEESLADSISRTARMSSDRIPDNGTWLLPGDATIVGRSRPSSLTSITAEEIGQVSLTYSSQQKGSPAAVAVGDVGRRHGDHHGHQEERKSRRRSSGGEGERDVDREALNHHHKHSTDAANAANAEDAIATKVKTSNSSSSSSSEGLSRQAPAEMVQRGSVDNKKPPESTFTPTPATAVPVPAACESIQKEAATNNTDLDRDLGPDPGLDLDTGFGPDPSLDLNTDLDLDPRLDSGAVPVDENSLVGDGNGNVDGNVDGSLSSQYADGGFERKELLVLLGRDQDSGFNGNDASNHRPATVPTGVTSHDHAVKEHEDNVIAEHRQLKPEPVPHADISSAAGDGSLPQYDDDFDKVDGDSVTSHQTSVVAAVTPDHDSITADPEPYSTTADITAEKQIVGVVDVEGPPAELGLLDGGGSAVSQYEYADDFDKVDGDISLVSEHKEPQLLHEPEPDVTAAVVSLPNTGSVLEVSSSTPVETAVSRPSEHSVSEGGNDTSESSQRSAVEVNAEHHKPHHEHEQAHVVAGDDDEELLVPAAHEVGVSSEVARVPGSVCAPEETVGPKIPLPAATDIGETHHDGISSVLSASSVLAADVAAVTTESEYNDDFYDHDEAASVETRKQNQYAAAAKQDRHPEQEPEKKEEHTEGKKKKVDELLPTDEGVKVGDGDKKTAIVVALSPAASSSSHHPSNTTTTRDANTKANDAASKPLLEAGGAETETSTTTTTAAVAVPSPTLLNNKDNHTVAPPAAAAAPVTDSPPEEEKEKKTPPEEVQGKTKKEDSSDEYDVDFD